MSNNVVRGEKPLNYLLVEGKDDKNIVQKVVETQCRFPAGHKIKAELHTWLAWQEEPGKPMGQAITKRYLDADAPHAQELIDWIRRLFDLA